MENIKEFHESFPLHSGSGLPFVSGANGSVASPIRKIEHMAIAE
jgi:hypothetical protein